MTVQTETMLNEIAKALHISEEDLLRQGLHTFLERKLRVIKADIFAIYGRYNVSSVEEIETRYKDGSLEEAGSWQDLQQLDHLEYERDHLQQLLETVL